MPTSAITATQGKSDRASQDISRKESNTISSWNINLELQTAQTPYPTDQTMKAITQTMMMYSYGLTSTSVNNTAIQVFDSNSIADKLNTKVFQAQKEHQLELKRWATAHNLTLDPEHQETWRHGTA